MGRLRHSFFRYHALFLFLLLEGLCFYIVGKQDTPLGQRLFQLYGTLAAQLFEYDHMLYQYTALHTINQEMVAENRQLKEALMQHQRQTKGNSLRYTYQDTPQGYAIVPVSERDEDIKAAETPPVGDTLEAVVETDTPPPLRLIAALVVNNNVFHTQNFLTLNKGRRDGIAPGMGIINKDGVVGRIRHVSHAFSTAYSLLHTNFFLSAMLKKNHTMGSVLWDGKSPHRGKLLYMPKHVAMQKGDAVVTSGYGKMFPRNVPIGHIADFTTAEDGVTHEATLSFSV